MRTVSTFQSNAGGVVLSIIIGTIAVAVSAPTLMALHVLSPEWWYLVPVPLGTFIAASFFDMGKVPHIPTQHVGVPKFLGQRITGWVLSEGDHWQIPGFMSNEVVNLKIMTTPIIPGEALSSDNVLMKGQIFFTLCVSDAHRNLSADHPLESLVKFGETELRNGIAAHGSDELEDPEMRSQLASEILARMEAKGSLLGFRVIKADIPEIMPPKSISDAAERQRIEEAEARAESVELNAVMNWVDQLGTKGIKPELALETMQTERGKATATRHIHRFEGLHGIAEALGGAATKVAETIKGDKK